MTNRSKMWLKPTDQMDLWLETQGYYRKHTARDGTSLFRAVAEQLGLTQHFHLELRRQCVDYVLLFKDLFKDKLACSLKEYEDRMRIPNEWGGEFELDVISRIYKCDFLIFQEVGQPAEDITGRGYDEKIMLCVSQERHYDSVYTKEHISDTAFCQSLVYEQLYKRAFNLIEVDFAVKKMLHDKAPRYQRDPCMSISGMALRLEMRDTCLNVKELLLLGVTPFPYKVAKSLDPEIYRNVEYDTWNDYRKGLRYGSRFWTSNELCVGVKCLVKLEDDKNFHGFIQEMEPDKGPVLVFIEELGEKMSVSYDSLELLPPPQPCCTTTAAGGSKQLRQLQAKLALQAASAAASASAQPDSTTGPQQQQQPPPKKKTSDHRRLKSCQPNEAEAAPAPPGKRRNANSCGGDSANYDQHSMQSSNYLASASSDCYEHELDYQQDIQGSYQHVHMYPTQSCEVTSSSVNYPQHCEGGDHVMSPYAAASPSPTAVYQMSAPPGGSPAAPASTAAAAYCAALNLVPTRSVHADGSDLPMADLPTLRYYYNIGLDYMRMNTCLVAQAQQAQSAAGRPAVGGQLPPHWPAGQYHAYVPADSPVPVPLSYVSHCYEPQPAVPAYAEAATAAVPYPSPAPVDYSSAVSADSAPPPPDSTSRVTASPNQPTVAPRFKNKRKNEQQTASAATSPSQVSNNKHQPSYSVASTTTPIPATVNAATAATATVSLPPSHFVPVYYHYPSTPATECDRNYCPGYYDSHWMPYEVPGAAALYPAAAGAATLYSAPQQASYLAADGVYYMQPATIEY